MSNEILRLKPDKVRQLIKQGKIKLDGDPADPSPIEGKPDEITTPINTPVNTFRGVSTKGVGRRRFLVGGAAIVGVGVLFTIKEVNRQEAAHKAEANRLYPGIIEKAAALFGEDFLGEQAIHKLEDKRHTKGIDVKFDIPNIPFHLNQVQLEAAKRDEQKGRARMVVLRPEFMTISGERKPITLHNLFAIYGFLNATPFANWFEGAPFTQKGLTAEFALPTKEVVPGSLDKNWNDQEKLIEAGESRREAVEAVWDILLYYGATGKRILESKWDWTKTQPPGGKLVRVGAFAWMSLGVGVSLWYPEYQDPNIGVCLSR